MRYFVLVLFFLSTSILLKGQDFWFRGQVIDSANVAIAFATITDKDYQMGTYTDENGFFEIQLQQQQALHLSAVGYESIDFNAQKVDSTVLFVLKEKTYRLSSIEIKPNVFRKEVVKWKSGKKKKITLSTAPQFAYQAGVYFPNLDKIGSLTIFVDQVPLAKIRILKCWKLCIPKDIRLICRIILFKPSVAALVKPVCTKLRI